MFRELLSKETALRREYGETPDFEDYARRYPRLRPHLERRMEALEALARDDLKSPLPKLPLKFRSRGEPTVDVLEAEASGEYLNGSSSQSSLLVDMKITWLAMNSWKRSGAGNGSGLPTRVNSVQIESSP